MYKRNAQVLPFSFGLVLKIYNDSIMRKSRLFEDERHIYTLHVNKCWNGKRVQNMYTYIPQIFSIIKFNLESLVLSLTA